MVFEFHTLGYSSNQIQLPVAHILLSHQYNIRNHIYVPFLPEFRNGTFNKKYRALRGWGHRFIMGFNTPPACGRELHLLIENIFSTDAARLIGTTDTQKHLCSAR